MYSLPVCRRAVALAALIVAALALPGAAESPASPAISPAPLDLAALADAKPALRPTPEIAWFTQGRAEALLDALDDASAHALPAARYRAGQLRAALATALDDTARKALGQRLTRAYLAYARDVASGALEPRRIARLIKVDPPRPDPGALLRAAAAAPDMAAHLASLPPQSPDYTALRTAYTALAADLAGADWGPRVPGGRTLRAGDADARVPALRRRLAALGHDAGPTETPSRMDAALVAAVEAFQGEYGLNRDGAVGPATLAALNTGPGFRLGQLAVNLERARWLNRPLGERRVMVNLPDFSVSLIDRDATLFHERVVIGRDQEPTPEFSDEMEHLVLNPTWFVPRSIATEDLLPKLQKDPTLLAQRNMQLSRPDGGPLPVDATTHDWSGYTRASFPYRIRQRPSASNALGRVKFMFPNNDNIYLHDTPQKNLFNKDRRAFSWGCVRVRDPLRLAEALLAPQMADPSGFIDRTLAQGAERYVHLDVHVPVHITYRTAWVAADGALQFRNDVYGRDALVLAALREAGVATPDS